jgi:hypothetical protein
MSAESDFQFLLQTHAPLTGLVSDRIAMAAQATPTLPAVVYLSRHDPVYGLGNQLLADPVTFTVQCWAETAAAAASVADAVRSACAAAQLQRGCVVAAEEPAYDEETGLDGRILSVEWWP